MTDLTGLSAIPGLNIIDTQSDAGRDRGRWLIQGLPGSGKTTLASTIAYLGPTLYLDMVGEKGTRSFQGARYEKNITVVRPDSVKSLDKLYYFLANEDHGFKAVVVDSLTSVQRMAMRYLLGHSETSVREIEGGAPTADMRTWGDSLNIMADLGTFWFALADGNRKNPLHVVMTAQTKVQENEVTGETMRVLDVQKGAINAIVANADYVLYAETEDNLDADEEAGESPVRHVVRFGAHPGYQTKARVPRDLEGKVPSIVGRGGAPNLLTLSRTLRIGGVPAAKKKPAATAAKTPDQATA